MLENVKVHSTESSLQISKQEDNNHVALQQEFHNEYCLSLCSHTHNM
jgi:hypothetical protein